MREIPLSKGYVALVDDEDYDDLIQFKWYANEKKGRVYAIRGKCIPGTRKTRQIPMHRHILGIIDDLTFMVDHKDHNGLNNTRANLRPCTSIENNRNTRVRRNKKSKYKGVCPETSGNKWRATINMGGRQISLGRHKSEAAAALAYNRAANLYFGEFAFLNQIAQC